MHLHRVAKLLCPLRSATTATTASAVAHLRSKLLCPLRSATTATTASAVADRPLLNAHLRSLLVCPLTKQPLRLAASALVNDELGIEYAVEADGVPNLVPSLARRVAIPSSTTASVGNRRFYSTSARRFSTKQPTLTVGAAKSIAASTLAALDNDAMSYSQALAEIKAASALNLGERWQAMTHVFLTAQLHAIVPYGFTPDEKGLKAFTIAFEELCRTHADLRATSQARWKTMAKRAFGVQFQDGDAISLAQARHISSMLALRMQSNAFLDTVAAEVARLGRAPTPADRQRVVLAQLLPLQQEVFAQFGFPGDDGYVKIQLALLEHSSDEQMAHNTGYAMLTVLRKAGVDLSSLQ